MQPRVVIVWRRSEYEELLARHGTHGQAAFYLQSRGPGIDPIQEHHQALHSAIQQVSQAIPAKWRRAQVEREDLDRFLFETGDVVSVIGPDGLVANVSKYLTGQVVIGFNPEPALHAGVLLPFRPHEASDCFAASVRAETEARVMVAATLGDGQTLRALNEIFIGHVSHQSARYRLYVRGASEEHSSSGVIVCTGTGATGWGRSIHAGRASQLALPHPQESKLAFFVREAFPSPATETKVQEGIIEEKNSLHVTSHMDAGVIFGDGIETDRLALSWGTEANIHVAPQRLHLLQR